MGAASNQHSAATPARQAGSVIDDRGGSRTATRLHRTAHGAAEGAAKRQPTDEAPRAPGTPSRPSWARHEFITRKR